MTTCKVTPCSPPAAHRPLRSHSVPLLTHPAASTRGVNLHILAQQGPTRTPLRTSPGTGTSRYVRTWNRRSSCSWRRAHCDYVRSSLPPPCPCSAAGYVCGGTGAALLIAHCSGNACGYDLCRSSPSSSLWRSEVGGARRSSEVL